MLPFHHLRHIAPLTAAMLLTLLIAPSAVAEQVSATSISQPQESYIEKNAVTILGTITDIFSCKHHPALPWCN
ncbi:MAG: hypothetical protein DI609_03740 [Corynebacterium urealyticum]|uniref:Secreted protein n=1 Tax=Corynebacterium urealyticum TaxID=43771 RepID=A0A2W5B7D3_9CORY|nr:MAG: hypothetical protein DI609_03740 [Corynebacterium urealyticum]